MSDTQQRLTTALLRLGQDRLAKLWGVDPSEVGRRLNGHRNIPFADFCKALDALGIRLITPEEDRVVVSRDRLNALRILARDGLREEDE